MTLLTFLYIFNFPIIKNIIYSESAFLVLIYCSYKMLLSNKYKSILRSFVFSKTNRIIVCGLGFIVLLAIIWPIAFKTYDFSYLKVVLHQLVDLEIGILLVALFKYKNLDIRKFIINSFFIQSLIQIASFISPSFLSFTDNFRSDSLIILRENNYVGYRGLAIAGSNFFGLAVAYGIVFLLIAFYWYEWDASSLYKVVCMFCLFWGALSSGRSAAIGIIIALICWTSITMSRINNKRVLYEIAGTIVSLVIVGIIVFYFFNERIESSSAWIRFHDYLFQFMSDDSTSHGHIDFNGMRSFTHMFNDMYFSLSLEQLVIGDGCYTNWDGSYYMHTDVGYMRNPLFFGLAGTIPLYLFHFFFVTSNYSITYQRKLLIILFVLTAIYELKGQVMGFMILSQSLILLIIFSFIKTTPNYEDRNKVYSIQEVN